MSLLSGSHSPQKAENTEAPEAAAKSRSQSPPAAPKDLLRHYASPGVPLPPSARIGDPKLKQREREPFRLTSLWKYGAFAAWKGEQTAPPSVHLHRPSSRAMLLQSGPADDQLQLQQATSYLRSSHISSEARPRSRGEFK